MAAVARQLEEQLKFYREIGVADIGGSLPAAKPALEANPAVRPPVTVGAASPPPEINAARQEPMPKKKDAPGQAALFGDLGPTDETAPAARPLPVIHSQDPSLEAIREEIGECTRCKLHEHRTHIVYGEGDRGCDDHSGRFAEVHGAGIRRLEQPDRRRHLEHDLLDP